MAYSPVDPLIRDFIRFRLRKRPTSNRTPEEYGRELEHLGRFLEQRPEDYHGPFESLGTATRADLVRFADALTDRMLAKTLSIAAVRRRLSALKSFYKYLHRESRRADDPATLIDLPETKPPLPKPVSEDNIATLLRAVFAGQGDFHRLRNRAMLELLYASGVRRAEIIGFNLEDVDFEQRTIRIVGKGGKPRIVVFNEAARDAMQVYLGHRPRTAEPAFFVTHDGRRISHSHIGKLFRQYAQLAQIGKATPHMMRHSFASHLIANGADLLTVQTLMGHESPVTTKRYIEITLEQAKKAYDAAHPRDQRTDR